MRTIHPLLSLILASALSMFSSLAAEDKPAQQFDQANKLYEQGKYMEAIVGYRKLLKNGSISSAVYFNLGNAFSKVGDPASAIVSLYKASQLTPRDPQINANLQFTQTSSKAVVFPKPSLVLRWLSKLTMNEWTTLAMLFGWIWMVMLIVRKWQPPLKEKLRGYTAAAGLLFLVVNLGLIGLLASNPINRTAIARSSLTVLKRGPVADAETILALTPGSELRLMNLKDSWFQVRTPSGVVGWVEKDQVILVAVKPSEL